jgi:hypothetical protein
MSHLHELAYLVKTGDPKTIKSYKAKISAALHVFQQLTDKIHANEGGLDNCVKILGTQNADAMVQQIKAAK